MNEDENKAISLSPAAEYGIDDVEQMSIFAFASSQNEAEKMTKLARHQAWLKSIKHECPNPAHPYKIGIYIRYFNQTKYENYLDYHRKQFEDIIDNCPRWTLVDFYIDAGQSAPLMENAPEWCRLIEDCFEGKVDLIITQKVSNVSGKPEEVTFCSRMLATQTPPIGIYFISEDIFTLATYYQGDMRDMEYLPEDAMPSLESNEAGGMLNE